jgi:hypothetical protein
MRTLTIIECDQVTGAFYDFENIEEKWVTHVGIISGVGITVSLAATFQWGVIDTMLFGTLGGCVGGLASPIFLYAVGKVIAYTYHAGFPIENSKSS